MARPAATQPLLDSCSASIGKAVEAARVALRDVRALRLVAPSSRVQTAVEAVHDLVDSAEFAAAAADELGKHERAAQAQLYPTTGREVQAVVQRPPHSPHVLGSREVGSR